MKMIVAITCVLLLFSACSTFGNFESIKANKTTTEEVRAMLGDPGARRFQSDCEVWEYQFTRSDQAKPNTQCIMNLSVSFKNGVVKDHKFTVSRSAGSAQTDSAAPVATQQKTAGQQMNKSSQAKPTPTPGVGFITQFDKNGDKRVSRDEFDGPPPLFDQFDKNRDAFIDESEAPPPPPQQRGQGAAPQK